MNGQKKGIALAVLAAALYALSSPVSKIMLDYMPPVLTAGLLYCGAGSGMGLIALVGKTEKNRMDCARFTKKDFPYIAGMVLLDVAAPVCLLTGLKTTTASNASLLNNFEIVATATIALLLFKEKISPRLWAGIFFVTLSCMLLSLSDSGWNNFSEGSLLILLACVCWGLENNCTRKLSAGNPYSIVIIKGIFSGTCSLIAGLAAGEHFGAAWSIPVIMLVGFVAYGLSIFFYVRAQRIMGAARTGAYYAVAPFIGAVLSLVILHEVPDNTYYVALAVMIAGAWLASSDKPLFNKKTPDNTDV